ncbi:alpha/beta fold hydrolase [Antrihabitans spumae]|jgi:pimeloyl-ACP methyl ester carboxylesterase|uniref:Alpha/beta fold hydrolase n=1 Tax=Antrihabitans spumae TaxID=3373370 RepID=A0ABW7KT53_9NOCA
MARNSVTKQTATKQSEKPRLHVERSGSGDATMLLIHGFSDNKSTWHKVTPSLGRRYRLLSVDLPGFGKASPNWSEPLIPGYVELLRELIETEGCGPVAVIGNSLGAVTALALASAHPTLVSSLVLADMPGIDRLPRLWQVALSTPTELALRAATVPVPAALLQKAIGIVYAGASMRHPLQPGSATVRTSFDTHYAEKSRVLGLFPLGRSVLRGIAELPIRAMVLDSPVPTMLLWGQYDLLTPSRKARSFFAGALRRVVVIADCGHCPQLDKPAEFLDAVLPFVRTRVRLAG